MFEYIFVALFWSILPLLFIGLIVYFLRRNHHKKHPSQNKNWYLQIALSKEDALSQVFFLLSLFFLGVTLFSLNKDLGEPFTLRLIVLVTSLLGFAGAYYFKLLYTLAFSLIGLTSWWTAQAFFWADKANGTNIKLAAIFAGLALIALLFYTLGHVHERDARYKRFAVLYLIFGILPITAALFLLSTKAGLVEIVLITKGASLFGSWQLTTSLLVLVISLIATSFYAVLKKLMSPFEFTAIFVLALLMTIPAFLPEQTVNYTGTDELSTTGLFWAITFNSVLFLELLGLILSGYMRRETWLVNLGAFFLFMFIIVKYFDWLFTFLDKSVFFITAGITLFIVGWLMEKGRKYMISNIKE